MAIRPLVIGSVAIKYRNSMQITNYTMFVLHFPNYYYFLHRNAHLRLVKILLNNRIGNHFLFLQDGCLKINIQRAVSSKGIKTMLINTQKNVGADTRKNIQRTIYKDVMPNLLQSFTKEVHRMSLQSQSLVAFVIQQYVGRYTFVPVLKVITSVHNSLPLFFPHSKHISLLV